MNIYPFSKLEKAEMTEVKIFIVTSSNYKWVKKTNGIHPNFNIRTPLSDI